MALVASTSSKHSEETATSCNDDEPFMNLLRFVDVASSRIRQALDRPRRCRRRVNHRKYLARILYSVDVTGSTGNSQHPKCSGGHNESHSTPGLRQLDRQSKRKQSQSARRHLTMSKMQSPVGSGPRSFAAVDLQSADHISTDRLSHIGVRNNDPAVAGYDGLLDIVQTRCRRPGVSSHLNEPVSTACADVSLGLPDWVTSTVNEPHHSRFSHRAAVSLPQQSQQLRPELADVESWYQPGFRQPYESPAGMRYTADYGDLASRYSFVNQQFFNASSSSASQQARSSACDVTEWLKHVTSSSRRYINHNNNVEYYCRNNYSTTQSDVSAYSLRTDEFIHSVTNHHCQPSIPSDPNLPYMYSTPTAVNLLQTPSSDQQFDDWMAIRTAENRFVDTSPSNCNDSGLGSISFGSTTDVDSVSTDLSFFWPSQYGVFPLQPTETHKDGVFMQML